MIFGEFGERIAFSVLVDRPHWSATCSAASSARLRGPEIHRHHRGLDGRFVARWGVGAKRGGGASLRLWRAGVRRATKSLRHCGGRLEPGTQRSFPSHRAEQAADAGGRDFRRLSVAPLRLSRDALQGGALRVGRGDLRVENPSLNIDLR